MQVTVDDIVVHYDLRGPKEAPLIVFANSLGTDFRVWDPLLASMPSGYRVLRYDKRGHGLSEQGDGPVTMQRLGRDLAGLMDALSLKDAVLCGLSIGGMIAQSVAFERPDLVSRLILMDTGHKIGSPELWNDRIVTVRAKGIGAMQDAILQRWFAPRFRAENPEALAIWRSMLVRTPVEGYARCCEAIRDADLTDQTRSLRVPTLCLVGSHDGSTPPALVRELAGLIEGSRFVEFADAAHLPCVEVPSEVQSTIGAFLDS